MRRRGALSNWDAPVCLQRRRYKIFIEAGGLSSLMNAERLDQDEFDRYCDHLIVRDSGTLQVVGTYRLLKPAAARETGRLYCESEFDLLRFEHLRGRMVEAGRACIHPDYRSGAVIMLLWAGLAGYLRRHHCDYLIGCASISLADGGANASVVYQQLATSQHIAPAEYRATPHLRLPLQQCDADAPRAIPPLLKAYLRSGAWICGEPAWDPEFHCADLLVLLPLANLDSRYARRYLTEKTA
ncbi:GNAT family N-acetyltransferase [Noviherbaspirillum saxi]|uniref:L-ornithine N(alpha)-acyltransferase n=1 Tax=Noviherbaspirillum saxi TaxID=2320863 RepID=A0A3A3FNJ6_9BURK|nr:GNAT family N-acyltransferase [Noviherbaspirillum saxi]RJF96321.1 GNAT family N-acetyltransferase [Noviherbaspirillum saxi]